MKIKFITKFIIILCDITIIGIIIYGLSLIHWTLAVAMIAFIISVIAKKIREDYGED